MGTQKGFLQVVFCVAFVLAFISVFVFLDAVWEVIKAVFLESLLDGAMQLIPAAIALLILAFFCSIVVVTANKLKSTT